MPSINNVWATNTLGNSQEITLPSGQTCMARKLDLEELIEAGFLTEIDAFTSILDIETIQPAKAKLQGRQAKQPTLKQRAAAQERAEQQQNQALMGKLADNPDVIKRMAGLLNRLIPTIVVEPKVFNHNDIGTPDHPVRMEGTIYTDMIDFLDKMELFTWAVGNLGDLAPFRGQPNGPVDGVADGGPVSVPSV